MQRVTMSDRVCGYRFVFFFDCLLFPSSRGPGYQNGHLRGFKVWVSELLMDAWDFSGDLKKAKNVADWKRF